MHRAHYRPPPEIGLEAMCVLCMAGPAAEEFFCGKIDDGSDETDYKMARDDALQIGFQLNRLRNAADRLVRTEWAQHRIRAVAAALLRHGTLTGDEIGVMIAANV